MTRAPELAVAMDWGGTWTRAAVIDRDGEILWQSRFASPKKASQAQLLESAEGLLREAIGWCANRPVSGVGIAVAGPVDVESGTLHDPPNLPQLDGISLKELWEPILGYPVWVGNDANLAALGEFYCGAGREPSADGTPTRTLVYLTVSTGIGGGVVDRGKMFLGANGLAAEIGHMSIDQRDDAPLCQCGNRGCLESLASGTAIGKAARARLAESGSASSVLAAGAAESVDSQRVFKAASQGDALATDILEEAVQALSAGLANTLHLYNPDLLVLGGGVTVGLTELELLPRIQSLINQRAMSERHKDFRLVASRLGDSVGLAGAAALVWQQVGTT
jgi:glucokinase